MSDHPPTDEPDPTEVEPTDNSTGAPIDNEALDDVEEGA